MRGDTLVSTKRGVYPIKELAEDFKDIEVLNYKGEWQPAIAVKSGKNQKLQKIVFKNGLESFCTKEHRWPVLTNALDLVNKKTGELKKKTTTELKPGDKIYLPSFPKPINNEHALLDRNDGMIAMSRIEEEEGLPEELWKSNHDYVSGAMDICLRAYGSVHITDELSTTAIRFLTNSDKLATELRKLLHLYGVRSTLGTGRQGEKHLVQITGMYAHKFAEAFRVDSKLFSKQLMQIKKKDTSVYKTPRHYLIVDEVIDTDQFEDVYDLTVYDDTNTFLTEFGITGNCGEITLCDGDSCRLLATNLYSYVVNPFTEDAYFDWEKFREMVVLGQRLMDDMVDIEIEHVDAIIAKIKDDPEPEHIKRTEVELWEKIRDKALRGRRTGFGITAMGDMLAALGYRYGSKDATDFADKLMKFKKHCEYESSCIMAQERGTFPIWDPEREKNNPFLLRIKDENPELYQKLVTHGRRNISISTIAPTGTVSLMAKTSSGIENVFSLVYFRKKKVNPNDADVRVDFVDKVGDSWQEYPVFHHHFKTFLKVAKGLDEEQIMNLTKEEVDAFIEESPYYKAMSNDVDWVEKVRMQGRIQKHIDHSISVTVNLPEDIPVETVHDVYMTGWESGCKGITVYRDNCRSGVLSTSSEKDKENKIVHNDAPKRPKSLEGDVYHVTALGERWTVIVGLIGEDPYEVFSVKGEIGRHKDRVDVRRVKRGHYNLEKDDEVVAEDFLTHNSEEQASIARLISTSLRHGAKIDFVVEQLNKTEGSIVSFSKAIARTLKRYITDEERQLEVAEKESLQGCPDDGQECELMHLEGCITCLTHGVSKCT
jgi:ribonucleotide reductase alpha subunit